MQSKIQIAWSLFSSSTKPGKGASFDIRVSVSITAAIARRFDEFLATRFGSQVMTEARTTSNPTATQSLGELPLNVRSRCRFLRRSRFPPKSEGDGLADSHCPLTQRVRLEVAVRQPGLPWSRASQPGGKRLPPVRMNRSDGAPCDFSCRVRRLEARPLRQARMLAATMLDRHFQSHPEATEVLNRARGRRYAAWIILRVMIMRLHWELVIRLRLCPTPVVSARFELAGPLSGRIAARVSLDPFSDAP